MTDKDKTHGGKRSGAGRQSYFGETTKVMRIPASQTTIIKVKVLQSSVKRHRIFKELMPTASHAKTLNV